jgi:hypothetical protein
MTENAYTAPSRAGSVVLEMGDDIGAFILEAPAELNGREIEISRAADGAGARPTHSLVRERTTAAGTSYAAVYVSLPAGQYIVWRDDDTPTGTVTVRGGQITHFRWPAGDGDCLGG